MAHITQTVPLSVIGWQGHGFLVSRIRRRTRDITVTSASSQLHQWSQFGQQYVREASEIQLYSRKLL
ncbi:hypothetical protein [Nocardia gamkensis]|uniref:Uncharacterized protein n=1 Tax=Nocardia gamkensis TaxID=352869 RepID=A0A7X6R6V3_9NOCA|nr:hypothetical protein [Nocardia gamkensis]NKY30776.1 hypothetical protein [Nocardia gamkensis]